MMWSEFPVSSAETCATRAAIGLISLLAITACSDPSPGVAVQAGVGSWKATPAGRVAASTVLDGAAWNGSDLFVWGNQGTEAARYSAGSSQWHSVNDEGAPVQRIQGIPLPLQGSSVAWLDAERALIWGGRGCTSRFATCNEGAVYDVQRNAWTSMPAKNPPRSRMLHSTLWTGDKMVVWGGFSIDDQNTFTYLADGGVYDPKTEEWKWISSTGAPAARSDHTAVWTGQKMLVWGGKVSSSTSETFFDDGGTYDLATDSWRPISRVGAPSPRWQHSAVWTGKEMIVWGGSRYESLDPPKFAACGDGAAYDPETDRWRPLAVASAPSPRLSHSAVWTGSTMIVWGGLEASGTRRDGAIYDPARDSWQPMQSAGAPTGRGNHWAFWTGSSMFVWGGGSNEGDLLYNDGAVFTP